MSSIDNALLIDRYALRAQPHAVLAASVVDGAAEIERLTRENALLQADKKRLNWLQEGREKSGWTHWGVDSSGCIDRRRVRAATIRSGIWHCQPTLRAAIDAAMDAALEATK